MAVTYGAIGSGGGIAQITARTVDFGASDAPLTPDQFTAAKGVVQIPWALAATLVAYNAKGVPNQLKLSGPVLAGIWMGTIKTWNDPAIAKLNPGVKPALDQDHSGLPHRRQRRHVRLHQLPVARQPAVAVADRHLDPGPVPDRSGRQGQLGRRRRDLEHERLDRLHRDLLRVGRTSSTTR